jgi:hypothetical protein
MGEYKLKRKLLICLMLLFGISTCPVARGGSRAIYEFGGHVYLIVNEPTTWPQADIYARAALGYLAVVSNPTENQFLFTNLLAEGISSVAPNGGGAKYAWIGGSDVAVPDTWLWVNGNPFGTSYANWGIAEPDNFGGVQDSLAMGLEGWPVWNPGSFGNASEWNDLDGDDNNLAYVIEFDSRTLDTDGDGMPDWQECVAATDPNVATSLLEITNAVVASTNIVIKWSSVAGRSYSLLVNTNLLSSNWVQVGGLIAATPPANSVTVTPSTVECEFYRVRVE